MAYSKLKLQSGSGFLKKQSTSSVGVVLLEISSGPAPSTDSTNNSSGNVIGGSNLFRRLLMQWTGVKGHGSI